MLELWLIRHGETDWNRERRTQGQSHNPLSDLGVQQAERLAVRLMHEHFDQLYCSDLKRAVQTADIVVPGADIHQDVRLRELSRGVLEGTTWDELTAGEIKIREELNLDRYRNRPPQGECFYDLECRVQSWLDDLPDEGRVMAVTHGGVIHMALHLITGAPDGWRFTVHNTSITRFLLSDDEKVILGVNDHAHLEGREALWSD